METLVLRKVINGRRIKLRLVEVGPKKLIGGGLLKLEWVRVLCPACGQQVEAVASDGQVKGYCAVAKQSVDFPIETQLERKNFHQNPEFRAGHSAGMKKRWQDPGYRAKQIAIQTGKHHTAETRAKVSAMINTAEARARRSTAMKKLWQDPEYQAKQIATHTGKHPTAKTKRKISAALKRRRESERRANEDK